MLLGLHVYPGTFKLIKKIKYSFRYFITNQLHLEHHTCGNKLKNTKTLEHKHSE